MYPSKQQTICRNSFPRYLIKMILLKIYSEFLNQSLYRICNYGQVARISLNIKEYEILRPLIAKISNLLLLFDLVSFYFHFRSQSRVAWFCPLFPLVDLALKRIKDLTRPNISWVLPSKHL